MNFLASFLIIVGYLLVTRKRWEGFVIQTAGCLIYIGLFIFADWSIVITNGVFTGVNLYGLYLWTRK